MKCRPFLSTTSLASLVMCGWLAGPMDAAAAGDAIVAEPDAHVEYSGTLSILTKFGLQQLSPYFVNAAKEYEKLHPGVKVELIQESDDSVKGKPRPWLRLTHCQISTLPGPGAGAKILCEAIALLI